MRQNGFKLEAPDSFTAGEVLQAKHGLQLLISIETSREAHVALQLMQEHDISQLPVLRDGRVVGSLDEVTLLKLLHDGVDLRQKKISEVMSQPMPQVEATTDIAEVYRYLMAGYSGVIITEGGSPRGVLARIDLANFWAGKAGLKGAA